MTDTKPTERIARMPVGVIVRRTPGVTRWAKWIWRAVGVHPGAGPGRWTEIRREGDTTDFHAGSVTLELHRSLTEGYLVALNASPPSVYVVMRPNVGASDGRPDLLLVTASAYEAQDYADNGEDIVEPVALPEGLAAWIGDFCRRHHQEETFVKRKRRPHVTEQVEDGIGDARVRQVADVYRAPSAIPKARS
jgi:hypothetical protein